MCPGSTHGGLYSEPDRIDTRQLPSDFDPNGYTVSVSNGQAGVVGTLDTLFVNDLEAGSYQVSLAGMASNCSTVPGENPLTVAVVAADTVNAEFEVTCDVPPPDGGGGGPVL